MNEPETPPRPSIEALAPAVVEQLGVAATQLKAGFAEMGRSISESYKQMREPRPPDPPPIDMSPRAVALRARQNRHTGPRGHHRRRGR